MNSAKPSDPPPGSTHRNLVASAWHQARILVVAALAAHGVTNALVSSAPLLTALAATLSFAAVWLYGARNFAVKTYPTMPGTAFGLYTAAFTAAGVLLGAWIIKGIIGSASAFYCASAIPWRIEIALFLSFVISLFLRMAHTRRVFLLTYPLILLALFWIVPFYGYFLAPVFLVLALITDCADRPIIQIYLVTFGIAAGNIVGNMFAVWLLETKDEGDG